MADGHLSGSRMLRRIPGRPIAGRAPAGRPLGFFGICLSLKQHWGEMPSMKSHQLVRPLGLVDRNDVPWAGRKAAVLGELLTAGFPVPDGFVIAADAMDRMLSAASFRADGLGADSPAAGDLGAADFDGSAWDDRLLSLPDDVASALDRLSAATAGATLAVRSSGLSEDSAGMSFAGQLTTVLDVRGHAALLDAVRKCWASAFSARVACYRQARRSADPVGPVKLAVLVQRMVAAETAGVAFSAEPVTGRRDEALVSAVHGLGDRLVSGLVTPEDWSIRGTRAVRRSGAQEVVDAPTARDIAVLARRVAAYLDGPQEIEWAIVGEQIWLLQARPITALPAPASR